MHRKRTTLRDIAKELDLSTQAVSMAMRNHRSIADKTRQRVQAKAAEMGYQVDPALQSLVSYRTHTKPKDERWTTLALLHDWSSDEHWRRDHFSGQFLKLIRESASRRGYKIEEHWLGYHSSQATECHRRLFNRGIVGVLLAPHSLDLKPVEMDVPSDRFEVVTSGPEHLYPEFLSVQVDYYENLRLAWATLREKGYQRIGLVYQDVHTWRTGEAWLAAYHIEKEMAGVAVDDLKAFIVNGHSPDSQGLFCEWLKHEKPDAIISSCYDVYEWTARAKPSVLVTEMNPIKPGRGGININLHHLTDAMIDMINISMQCRLSSHKVFPYRVHIQGYWQDPI